MSKQEKYFNRDLSWLSFNDRVLREAFNEALPLYERIKFLAIFSSNLEEFYRVRVSYYRSLIRNLPDEHPKIKEVDPKRIIFKINRTVSKQQGEFNNLFYNKIIPALKKEGIMLVDDNENLNLDQESFLYHTFRHDILPSIQPVLLVRNRIKPFLKTGHMYIALQMFTKVESRENKGEYKKGKIPKYGLIKLPTDHGISRFIELPPKQGKHYVAFLEDVIMRHATEIFPGYYISHWYSMKVTRDADFEYEDYDGEDLIEIIENIETTRAIGLPNRFQFDSAMPQNMISFLTETFGIDKEVKVKGGRTHNFRDFFTFPNPKSPELEHEKFIPMKVGELENAQVIFDTILEKDILLHFPYQSFDYFIKYLDEAANSDTVTDISTTMYRVATNSVVVDTLIKAALNGKNVRVFVELKARFDESANLEYSKEMEKAGINIIYSLPGLKVHSKLAMVTRRNRFKRKSESTLFMGTGNFNEKTARIYCDEGLFTANKDLIKEVNTLFTLLESKDFKSIFNKILVPNFNLVPTFTALINKEIKNHRKGLDSRIILKMNGLEDPYMIDRLYEASKAGVKIDCIVRGICRIIPDMPFSKNIRVVRIVDRFLEHSRMFYFHNNGDPKMFLGSADWMRRNLYKRIECVFPIYSKSLRKELFNILQIQLSDNVSACVINKKSQNVVIKNKKPKVRSQVAIYDYLLDRYKSFENE